MPGTTVCLTPVSWRIAKCVSSAVTHPNLFAIAKSCKNKFTSNNRSMCLLLVFAFITWGWHEALAAETVGQQYRRLLAQKDARCRQDKIGPYLDVADPEYRDKARLTNCDVLEIKAFDLATVLATAEGEFAYSIKLPPPLDKPRISRRNYRSSEEYFQELCAREAGDYVFVTKADIDGIAVLRTPLPSGRQRLSSYSEESTVSQAGGARPELLLVQAYGFEYVERRTRPDEASHDKKTGLRRCSRDLSRPVAYPDYALRCESIKELSARYGVIWRGVPNLESRDEGVVGGDLIIIDRQFKNVLAVRREFTLDSVDVNWKDSVRYFRRACPGKITTEGFEFIARVLRDSKAGR